MMRNTTLVVAVTVLAACTSGADRQSQVDGTPSGGEPPEVMPLPATPEPLGPQPDFGDVAHAALPPPPISGGTMAAAPLADGNVVVVSDPDRDRVHVVDITAGVVLRTVAFARGSEPGRVVVDDSHRAHIVLRGTNEVATIAVTAQRRAAAGAQNVRHPVCAAPRGIAYMKPDRIVVACADGNLDVLRSDTGERLSRQDLGRDLRDVLVDDLEPETVHVTRFRSAELLKVQLGASGAQHEHTTAGSSVAWRAVSLPPQARYLAGSGFFFTQSRAIVEQEAQTDQDGGDGEQPELAPVAGGYGETHITPTSSVKDTCDAITGIVRTRVELAGGQAVRLPSAVLPVDLAVSSTELVVVAAGNAFVKGLPQLFIVKATELSAGGTDCVHVEGGYVDGQAIAAVFTSSNDLVVQTREPNALHVMARDRSSPARTIPLPGPSVADTGHQIFHSNAGNFLACASCHPEGMDDGRTWRFSGKGPRRTPTLRGTLRGTAPFHWDGDMQDLRQLVDDVFSGRMSGPAVDGAHFDALSDWLFSLPPPARLRGASDASGRGKALFTERCSSCHDGVRFTNNRTVDVGTGAPLQVPSLVGVAWRAPYLHDGCAATLLDRFGPACGTEMHGDTKGLGAGDLTDIVAYLETL